MDPVSHLLFGRTVALSIRRDPARRGVGAALVLGSILPDVDAALAPRAFDVYLLAHASGTHSFVGTLAGALVLTAVMRAWYRTTPIAPLFIASWTGVLGHVFCDLANGSDIRILAPFSKEFAGWHLIAMGEPIVLMLLGAAVVVAWRWPQRARHAAHITLAVLMLFLAAKRATQASARTLYAAAIQSTGAPQAVAISPAFGSLFRWTVYDRVDDQVRAWRVDSLHGTADLAFAYRDANAPAVSESRSLPVVRALLDLGRVPFVRIEGGVQPLVLWSDLTGCTARRCDVSFGAEFDRDGTPHSQLIRIGTFTQSRPLAGFGR